MSIWRDAFQAYLDADASSYSYGDTSEDVQSANANKNPVLIMLFINQANGQSPLGQIDAQYQSLVQQFGKDAVDAIRKAIEGGDKPQDKSDDK